MWLRRLFQQVPSCYPGDVSRLSLIPLGTIRLVDLSPFSQKSRKTFREPIQRSNKDADKEEMIHGETPFLEGAARDRTR